MKTLSSSTHPHVILNLNDSCSCKTQKKICFHLQSERQGGPNQLSTYFLYIISSVEFHTEQKCIQVQNNKARVNNDRIVILGWTIPLRAESLSTQSDQASSHSSKHCLGQRAQRLETMWWTNDTILPPTGLNKLISAHSTTLISMRNTPLGFKNKIIQKHTERKSLFLCFP